MNLLSVTWNVYPVLFHLGSMEIRWYGVLFALAFIVSYVLLKKMFTQEKVDVVYLDKMTIYIFIGVLIGARLGHCLFYAFGYYSHHIVEMFLPIKIGNGTWKFVGYQGLASHGGAIGILLAMILYTRHTNIPYMWSLDRLVVAVCFAGASIRLGNLMNSEIYGVQTSLPWGFVFVGDGSTVPCHPTQLYETLSYIILGIVLYSLSMRKTERKLNQGMIFGIFLVALFGVRFLIEFLKNDQEAWEAAMPINMGQILSIPFMLVGVVCIILATKKDIGRTLDRKQLKQLNK